MNLFVTGGTGSIGRAVLAQALAAGHEVTALVRSQENANAVQQAGATPIKGDLAQPEAWAAMAAQSDVFIHLGSSFDDAMADTEPRLISSLARHAAARTTPLRVLYTGGCWLYGPTHNAVAHEHSPFNPPTTFDWAVKVIAQLDHDPQFSTAVLHPAMVYDATGGAFSRYLTALRASRPPTIWGDAQTRWPLVHRDDVAAAYLLLAAHRDTGNFNIAAEPGVTAAEITDTLRAQAGMKAPAAVLPRKWVLNRHGAWAEGPMLDQQMRSDRMADLDWQPRHADFRQLEYGL